MPQKDALYHEAAIQYNDELSKFASNLAERLENEEVARWSRAVAKQHKFHSGRHQKALNKLKNQEKGAVENTEDGGEDKAVDVDSTQPSEETATPKMSGIFSDPFKVSATPDTSQDAAPVHNQGEEV